MGIKVFIPTSLFVDNISLVLNVNNLDSTLNKKTVALSYNFVCYHVYNNVVELMKIQTKDNFADLFTKLLVSNYFHGFYHEFVLNG